MTASTKYGLIGSGMMGREHIRNLALIPNTEIVTLVDPNPQSLNEAQELIGQDVHTALGLEEVTNWGHLDALIIASPNDRHCGTLEQIHDLGLSLPILTEKPICVSEDECMRIEKFARQYGAPVWVAMEYRYMAPIQEMLAWLKGEDIGDVHMLSIREHRYPFLRKVGDWNRFSARTGGTLVEKCCHFFDLMRLLIGDEPTRLHAIGGTSVNHLDEVYDGQTPDILDHAYVIVEFSGGAKACLELCMFADGSKYQEDISIVTDKVKIESLIPGPTRFQGDDTQSEAVFSVEWRDRAKRIDKRLGPESQVLAAGDHFGSTYFEHLRFLDMVRGKGSVEVTLEDGVRAVRMGLAAEACIKSGQSSSFDFK